MERWVYYYIASIGGGTLVVFRGHSMDDSSYRQNFDLGKKNKINHYI
jgi:hypothetical protein